MKKIKFLMIIAIVAIIGFSMTSCRDLEEVLKFGGTLTINNNTGGTIIAYAINPLEEGLNAVFNPSDFDITSFKFADLEQYGEEIEKGKAYKRNFKIDGKVYWYWTGLVQNGEWSPDFQKGEIEMKGGKDQSFNAKTE